MGGGAGDAGCGGGAGGTGGGGGVGGGAGVGEGDGGGAGGGGNGGSFLGKPYEPNAAIKNDIEFILMERKPGGYRQPDVSARVLSLISQENHHRWFRQIWSDVAGASTRTHPAPYPIGLAERLIRMFSFAGDTVLDPFLGTGTTSVAAACSGRNSVGLEVDPHYFRQAVRRLRDATQGLFSSAEVEACE